VAWLRLSDGGLAAGTAASPRRPSARPPSGSRSFGAWRFAADSGVVRKHFES